MYDNAKETNYMKTNSFIAWLTLITALTISGVAIFYSVSGLAAIFSAAVIPIIIMGGVLEVSKLVTAVWLHRYWGIATWWLKTYLSIAVLVLMLITSIGIFGFLSKAHDTASGNATEAIATVTRIDGQIAREENRIEILGDRITGISSGTGFDITSSITQQETIRDGAWDRVQDEIDYAKGQIQSIRDQLVIDLKAQDDKLIPLDSIINSYADQGTTTTETDAGGLFRSAEIEVVDNVAKANQVRQEQKPERDAIEDEKDKLRRTAQRDINSQQSNIDSYRGSAETTIADANREINLIRDRSTSSQDDDLNQIDEWNLQIDGIYTTIDGLKDEKFESEQTVRLVESEVGPIRYIAEFFTGTEDADANLLESAVSWLIMVIIFVFDPLAVLLLIASQYTFEQRKKENPSLEKPEPPEDPNPQPLGGFEGFDTVPFGMDDNIEKDYELMKEDIDSTELESGFDFTKIQPSIDEVRNAFNEWEESQKLLDAASVEKNQVVEPVPEPISKDPTFLRQIEETKQAFKEYYGDNPQDTPDENLSQGVTYQKVEDSEYLVGPDGSIHQNALKMAHPELFLAKDSEGRQASTNFGTIFPSIAMKGDIFVRVDQMPNRVYKFEGKSWIEIDKATTDSYTFDEEYIEYIISQIKSGEYDIDLLSDSERIQVETYLTKNSG